MTTSNTAPKAPVPAPIGPWRRRVLPALRVLWGVGAAAFVGFVPFGLIVPPVLPIFLGPAACLLCALSAAAVPPEERPARRIFLAAGLAYLAIAAVALVGFASPSPIPQRATTAALVLVLAAPLPLAGWAVWRLGKAPLE